MGIEPSGIGEAFADRNFHNYAVGAVVSWLCFFVQFVAGIGAATKRHGLAAPALAGFAALCRGIATPGGADRGGVRRRRGSPYTLKRARAILMP